MNAARLVAGWIFLMGMAAAGAYYATDEVDQRVNLSKLNVYEKLGVTKYAVASVAPSHTTPVNPGPVNPPGVANPPANPGNDPGYLPPNNSQPIQPVQPPANPQQAYQPPVNPQQAYQPPVNPQQAYQQPPVNPQQVYQQVPGNRQQAYQQPGYPQRGNQQRGYPQQQPQQAQPFPNSNQMPADFGQARTRLTELQGQAQAEVEYWQSIRASLASMHQPLRPEISAALSTLSHATAGAEQALRGGDTGTARQQMDLAEKQLRILNKAKE